MDTHFEISGASVSIVVDAGPIIGVPVRWCAMCKKTKPLDPTTFKVFKTGAKIGQSARTCLECSRSSTTAPNTRGLKRKVLGEVDPNIATNRPQIRLKPAARAETLRWFDGTQETVIQRRETAVRERDNRNHRAHGSPLEDNTENLDWDNFPETTPPPPIIPQPPPISPPLWAAIGEFNTALDLESMEKCRRYKEKWFGMKLDDAEVCGRCNEVDKGFEPSQYYYAKCNNMDPGDVPDCLKDLTQMEEMLIAKAHCHMVIKRVRGLLSLLGSLRLFLVE